MSIDGTDDYIQAGLVAYASASAWAQGRRDAPAGRRRGRPSSAARTATRTAPTCPRTRRRRSRCRCTRVTASSAAATRSTTVRPGPRSATASTPADSARRASALAAYNGTGAEVGTFEAFTVGEPPELPPTPPCETPNTPEAGYTMLFDGTDASLAGLEVRRRRALRARRLHDQVRRRVRPDVHQAGLRGALLAQARVDDARGRQLRRLRRLPRHRGEHGRHLDQPGRGDPDRPDGQPGPDHGRDLPRAGGGRRRPRRGAQARRVSGTRTRSSCARTASSSTSTASKINEWLDDDPNVDLATGHIGLQMHGAGDDVFFRNVRVQQLEESVDVPGTVGGTVPATLSLTLDAPARRSGRSCPTWTGPTRPPRRPA